MFFKSSLYIATIILNGFLDGEQLLVSNFSESEYQSVERVFANNTGHIDHLVDIVSNNIEDQSKKTFLDIGAGPATITTRLSKLFEETAVVDPNQAFAPIYADHRFTAHIGNFQDIALKDKYDFVLCSHVLYHVPHTEWPLFVKKIYESLQPGGKGIISLVAPKGKWHTLRSSINPNYSNSGLLEKILTSQNIPYRQIAAQSIFKVADYTDFRALVRLFTIDDCYLPDEYQLLSATEKQMIDQKIDDYISDCRQSDGSYEFLDEDAHLLLLH